MRKLINNLNIEKLENAKQYLVPHVFTENYFKILKMKLNNKQLSYNEQYYYNHFITKKLKGMMELFNIEGEMNINNKPMIKKDRLTKAISLIKKYSRKHKNMKMLVTGSFLYNEKYSDIDIFILSKYNKEDYREGKVHINFLPADIEKTLFFKSLSAISIANFTFDELTIEEKFSPSDILHLYEVTILLIMQNDEYINELRELVLRAEYTSHKIILDSRELKEITEKIKRSESPIKVLNKYIITKIINSSTTSVIKKVLHKFIEKNKMPERGKKLYPNWKIYNRTYLEAMEVVT